MISISINDDVDLGVRSEDGEYLDLSADNDDLAIVEAVMSEMVIKVASSDPEVVVKLRDMVEEVCLQDDFERNKAKRYRRKKVDESMWQVNKNKKNRSSGKAYLWCKKDKVSRKWSKVFKKEKEKGKNYTSNRMLSFLRTRYNKNVRRLLEVPSKKSIQRYLYVPEYFPEYIIGK